jgi:hypothetical protein
MVALGRDKREIKSRKLLQIKLCVVCFGSRKLFLRSRNCFRRSAVVGRAEPFRFLPSITGLKTFHFADRSWSESHQNSLTSRNRVSGVSTFEGFNESVISLACSRRVSCPVKANSSNSSLSLPPTREEVDRVQLLIDTNSAVN